MSGSKQGAAKAKATIIAKFGEDFWKKAGAIGGKASNTGGFADEKVGKDGLTGKVRAKVVGAKGGAISKRGPKS